GPTPRKPPPTRGGGIGTRTGALMRAPPPATRPLPVCPMGCCASAGLSTNAKANTQTATTKILLRIEPVRFLEKEPVRLLKTEPQRIKPAIKLRSLRLGARSRQDLANSSTTILIPSAAHRVTNL